MVCYRLFERFIISPLGMTFSFKRFFRKSYAVRSMYWLTVLNWFDLSVKLTRVARRPGEKKRVAFVKMDGIGDYVIWSAVFERLRIIYPSDRFDRILVANDRFQQLAENEPTFDETIFLNLDRFAVSPIYRYRMMKKVRSAEADIIINARSARDLLWSDSMVRCSAAREKIGSEGTGNLMGPLQERLTRRWYTELRAASVPGQHELVSNLKFLGLAEIESSISSFDKPALTRPTIPGPYAVFFPGAQINEKCWPAADFGRAADIICQKHGLTAVLCGGPGDRELAGEFSDASSLDHIDLVGKTSLVELSALLAAAALVVSNDTGAAHIAVMSGTPTVVIASGNEVGRYFPYPESVGAHAEVIQYPDLCTGCKEACVHSRWSESAIRPCIKIISVDDVSLAADKLMSGSERRLNVG